MALTWLHFVVISSVELQLKPYSVSKSCILHDALLLVFRQACGIVPENELAMTSSTQLFFEFLFASF